VLLLGLPWWLWTTQIHRAELPTDAVEALKQVGALDLQFPANFHVFVAGNSEKIKRQLEEKLKRWEQVPTFGKATNRVSFKSSVLVSAPVYQKDANLLSEAGSDEAGSYHVHVFHSTVDKVYIGANRYLVVYTSSSSETEIAHSVGTVLDSVFLQERDHLIRHLDDAIRETAKSRTVKYSSRYHTTLSMLIGDADVVCSWDIGTATSVYLEPFFHQFRPYVDMDVVSQMQYAAALNIQPEFNESDASYSLKPEQLPTFINSAEWNLANLDASGIPLNFILYRPSKGQSPLHLLDSKGNVIATHAFLIPRWGGITVSNLGHCNLTRQELKPFVEIVVEQLRKVLGVQPVEVNLLHAAAKSPVGLTGWELDRWIRKRTAENVVNAARTLTSLTKLITNMRNMVVMDEISNSVEGSLKGLHDTIDALKHGNTTLAFAGSRQAVDLAESAFFDPTMVSMLYFPTEHRFAIYMPLFVPAAVPLLTASIREFQDWKKQRRTKRD